MKIQSAYKKNTVDKTQLLTSFSLLESTKNNYKRIAKKYIDFTLKHKLNFNSLSQNAFLSKYSVGTQNTYKTATKRFLKFCDDNKIDKATNASITKSKIDKNFTNLSRMFLAQLDTNKEATKKSYNDALKSFSTFLDTEGLAFFGQKQVIEFRNSFKSPYTSNMYLSAIRNFCKYLILNIDSLVKNKKQKETLITELKKCIKIKNLKIDTQSTIIKGVLTSKEIEVILNSVKDKKEKILLALLAYGGLRTIEIVRLNFNDIVLSENYIRIQGKGNNAKTQSIPILSKLKGIILECLNNELTSNKKVFTYSTSHIRAIVNKYLNKNQLKYKANVKVSAHSFRHSLAVNLLLKKVPIYTVQAILRHKSLETTQIYIKYLQQKEMLSNDELLNVF